MSDVVTELLVGLLGSAITALVIYVRGRTRVSTPFLLPGRFKRRSRASYQFIAGRWYAYYVSFILPDSRPVWIRGDMKLSLLRNGTLRGRTTIPIHDGLTLTYLELGEIRGGWLLLTGACVEELQEFATLMFPNLLTGDRIVGLWTGQDNTRTPISAPVVLSRGELTARELNEAVSHARLRFVPEGFRPRLHPLVAIAQQTAHPDEHLPGPDEEFARHDFVESFVDSSQLLAIAPDLGADATRGAPDLWCTN